MPALSVHAFQGPHFDCLPAHLPVEPSLISKWELGNQALVLLIPARGLQGGSILSWCSDLSDKRTFRRKQLQDSNDLTVIV